MKALLLCRPGDFGSLEDHWHLHPLTLPVLNRPVYQHHATYLYNLGVREVRILQGGEATLTPRDLALEALLNRESGGIEWSLRAWPQGPWPQGRTLPEILREQNIFQDGEDLLVLSAPLLPLEPLTGPKVPPLFPQNPSMLLGPRLLSPQGNLAQTDGLFASLIGPQDFFRTQLRLLGTIPPAGASLRGVNAKAVLEPPLLLAAKIRVAAGVRLGPDVILAPGTRLERGARLERCVVLQKVLVGREAEFVGKILIGSTVLDPENGGSHTVTDQKILKY